MIREMKIMMKAVEKAELIRNSSSTESKYFLALINFENRRNVIETTDPLSLSLSLFRS